MKLRINENEYLGGRDYTSINPVRLIKEYIDFLKECGIEVLGVRPKVKSIVVKDKDLEDASFYLQDKDYFGKDLYAQGWSVVADL